jgi:plastocyanin
MTRWVTASLLFLLLFVQACSSSGEPGAVVMTDEQTFSPARITVQAGDTVTWTNESGMAHTVTAYSDSLPDGADYFSSGHASSEQDARANIADELLQPDQVFKVTFDEPGTYRYFCIPHEDSGMTGTVVVE